MLWWSMGIRFRPSAGYMLRSSRLGTKSRGGQTRHWRVCCSALRIPLASEEVEFDFGHRQAKLALHAALVTPRLEIPAAKIAPLERFLNAASNPFIRKRWDSISAIGRSSWHSVLRSSRLGSKSRGGQTRHWRVCCSALRIPPNSSAKTKGHPLGVLLSWRKRWDSNPRALADNRISSAARCDHFDTLPIQL